MEGLTIFVFCMCLKGRSYIKKIQKKKEKNVFSAKILEKLLDKGKGNWYDSNGKDPLYKDRTILYEKEKLGDTGPSGLPLNIPDMHTESPKEGKLSLLNYLMGCLIRGKRKYN